MAHEARGDRRRPELQSAPIGAQGQEGYRLDPLCELQERSVIAFDAKAGGYRGAEPPPRPFYVDIYRLEDGCLRQGLRASSALPRDGSSSPASEHERLGEGIARQPVRSMDAGARTLTNGIQPRDRRPSIEIRLNATDRVVGSRHNGDQIGPRVDAGCTTTSHHRWEFGFQYARVQVPAIEPRAAAGDR
jgi:hypothetical protein